MFSSRLSSGLPCRGIVEKSAATRAGVFGLPNSCPHLPAGGAQLMRAAPLRRLSALLLLALATVLHQF